MSDAEFYLKRVLHSERTSACGLSQLLHILILYFHYWLRASAVIEVCICFHKLLVELKIDKILFVVHSISTVVVLLY